VKKPSASLTLGIALVLFGVVLIYAGWKDKPILSIFGLGSSGGGGGTAPTTTAGGQPNSPKIPTVGGTTQGTAGTKLYGPGYGTSAGTNGAPAGIALKGTP
jgi:hypothetical protein